MKEEKKHVGRPTNEEVEQRKDKKVRKVVLSVVIGVVALFAIISIGSVIFTNSKSVKLGKTATIEKDSIKITVLESQKATVDNGELSLGNGKYTKVKVKIENYGNETYTWGAFNFYLGGKTVALNTLAQSDILQEEIAPGETASGYLYFEESNDILLEYSTSPKMIDEEKATAEKVYFRIK